MARLKIRNGNTWEDISAITGPQGIPGEPGTDGADGIRGTSILRFGASPSSCSVSDKPAIHYRVNLETLLDDSGFSEVYIGDIVEAAYLVNGVYYTYHYFVLDVDDTYVYLSAGYDLKGAKGDTGDISNEVLFAAPYITTFSEIEEAVSDEKTVILVLDNGNRAMLTNLTSTVATFTQLIYSNHMIGAKYTCTSSDVWAGIQVSLAPTASPTFTGVPTAPTAPDGTDTTQIATTEFVQNAILALFPVGSIYMSVNNVNPSTYLSGTTWEAWGSGKVPVGVDVNDTDFDTVEETGGEKTHTLTVNEIPSHNHDFDGYSGSVSAGSGSIASAAPSVLTMGDTPTSDTGGGQAHNNMPPYITCYMWKRTA